MNKNLNSEQETIHEGREIKSEDFKSELNYLKDRITVSVLFKFIFI